MKKIIMLLTVMASAMILAGCASHQCGCNAPAQAAPAHQDYKGEVSNTK